MEASLSDNKPSRLTWVLIHLWLFWCGTCVGRASCLQYFFFFFPFFCFFLFFQFFLSPFFSSHCSNDSDIKLRFNLDRWHIILGKVNPSQKLKLMRWDSTQHYIPLIHLWFFWCGSCVLYLIVSTHVP